MPPRRDQAFPQPDDWVARARQIESAWEADVGRKLSVMQRNLLYAGVSGRSDWYIPPETPLDHPQPGEDSPAWYFFYGTLTDPEWLEEIADLDEPPEMLDAKLSACCIRYWGPYPVLVMDKLNSTNSMGEVVGQACLLPTLDAVQKVRAYETNHYVESVTRVDLVGGGYKWCRVFMWRTVDEEQYLTKEPTEDPQPPLGWD